MHVGEVGKSRFRSDHFKHLLFLGINVGNLFCNVSEGKIGRCIGCAAGYDVQFAAVVSSGYGAVIDKGDL